MRERGGRAGEGESGRRGTGTDPALSPIPSLPHASILPFPHASLLLFLLLLLGGCGGETYSPPPDQPLAVNLTLSTNQVRIGDLVELDLQVYHPVEGELTLPELARGRQVVVRDQRTETRPLTEETAVTEWHGVLTSFEVGPHVLSTGQVEFVRSDGTVLQEPFPFTTLEVQSTLGDGEAVLRDIKGTESWPRRLPRWVIVLATVGLLALLAALAAARFLAKPRTILQQAPPEPADVIARRALRALRNRGWIESDRAEPFYVELSGIVRHYLENRFGLRAPERTTEEFIRDATTSRLLSPAHQALTSEFLEQSDLVKFARHHPRRADMEEAFASAERLADETRAVEQEAA